MGGFDRLGLQVGDQGAECRFAFGHGRGELVERVACQSRKRAPALAGSDLGIACVVDERAGWSVRAGACRPAYRATFSNSICSATAVVSCHVQDSTISGQYRFLVQSGAEGDESGCSSGIAM